MNFKKNKRVRQEGAWLLARGMIASIRKGGMNRFNSRFELFVLIYN